MRTPTTDPRTYTRMTYLVIGMLTLWRVVWLRMDGTTLSTDEAQYWFWGQSFAFGAYSKPPLIGWLIRLTTELAGNTVFGARIGAPLVHAGTALIIFALGIRVTTRPVAAFAALSYITLPAVALGSILITTDTPLLFFAALSLLAQHKLAQTGGAKLTLALGIAIGLAFMSKYAMIYVVLGMIAAAIVSRDWRISWRATLATSVIAVLIVLPNMIWIATHSFATVEHVTSDADWAGLRLYPVQALRFVAEQLAVMGPVLFVAWLWGLTRLRKMTRAQIALYALYALSILPLLVVTGQALFSRALANWGVTFVLAGVIVASVALENHRVLRRISLGLTLLISLALPVFVTLGTNLRMPDGRLYLHRYVAQPDIIDWALDAARAQNAGIIVADGRDVLSALTFAARGTGITINAPAGSGTPHNHWELLHRYDPRQTSTPVFILAKTTSSLATLCPDAATQQRTAGQGFVEGQDFVLVEVTDTTCLKGAAYD
ncbi:MAG: glycosyltransferase family 39 protein [Celeribacter marinus]